MTTSKAAPEIFQIPLEELDPDMVPAGTAPGSPGFEQALIMHFAMKYSLEERFAGLLPETDKNTLH